VTISSSCYWKEIFAAQLLAYLSNWRDTCFDKIFSSCLQCIELIEAARSVRKLESSVFMRHPGSRSAAVHRAFANIAPPLHHPNRSPAR
jgi:hypothetical protein